MAEDDANIAMPERPKSALGDADVLGAERAAVTARRKHLGHLDTEADDVGLALSGGGIRSASFGLGVLQALDTRDCFPRIDYLSTVSGGGYIGCCLTATMSNSGGRVPFNEDKGFGDTPAVHHIRDFSNYLMPRGFGDLVTSFGLIGRGWAANAILLAPLFLLSTLLLLLARPTVESLKDYGPIQWFAERAARDHRVFFVPGFPDTTFLIELTAGVLALWALWRSLHPVTATQAFAPPPSTEFHGRFVAAWKMLIGLIALFAWLELQPLVLRIVADALGKAPAEMGRGQGARVVSEAVGAWFTKITPYLAPIGAIVAFMSRNLAHATASRKGTRMTAALRRIPAKLILWFAAVIIPSAIWYLYLRFTLVLMPAAGSTYVVLIVFLVAFLIAALFIDPNATSLHQLYRDRLSKAFLFDAWANEQVSRDLPEISPRLHEIDLMACPFPIVNAAVNLEGSAFANRRGRNADFFEFTPLHVGSEATGWAASRDMNSREPKLDLGTAMAISGAAFSPNMGSATIKPLVPTLALLNMRLGFWLRNPRYAREPLTRWRQVRERRCFLLFKEVFSRIDETSPTIYVTDGGNIENLGVYALLKRRCKLVIAVDAEADPAMTFGAYLKLQRYARIDLGVLLDLPWQAIRDSALALDAALEATSSTPKPTSPGPHIAVGTIRYGNEAEGILVYVKASLTGDEADYILDYKARNPDFPHETTGDQFFGEEQLEVYRALGFHITRYFLDERAPFEVTPMKGETIGEARTRVMTSIRTALALRH